MVDFVSIASDDLEHRNVIAATRKPLDLQLLQDYFTIYKVELRIMLGANRLLLASEENFLCCVG